MPELAAAPATDALIVATVAASLYGFVVGAPFISAFAFNVGAVKRGGWHRAVTSAFLHGDIFHLLANMVTFWSFGPAVEQRLGTSDFLLLYGFSMLCGDHAILWANAKNPEHSAIGASGAVSGVLLAACLFDPLSKIYFFAVPIGIPAVLFAVIFVGASALLMRAPGRVVSHEGHLGGALGGLVLAALLQPDAALHWLR